MIDGLSGKNRQIKLIENARDVLKDHCLIIASNRGPVEHQVLPDGRFNARRGSGGVVTALGTLTNNLELTWISSAMGEGDRKISLQYDDKAIKSGLQGQNISLRYVMTPRRVYHKFYNVFCNPLLWFLQHSMWSSTHTPNIDEVVYDAWTNGYVSVNQSFADVIVEESNKTDRRKVIIVHDYHLYLAPGMIREKLSDALIQYFLHVPWPDINAWHMLPLSMRKAICESLLAADIVGFQTLKDARSFLQCCESFVDGSQVDHINNTVKFGDNITRVRVYPVAIETDELKSIANTPRAQMSEEALKQVLAEKNVVRIDRIEPSKNIVRGFRAYSLMLTRHPELVGKVKFLAFLVPSRTHIRQYQRYIQEVEQSISEVNNKFGNDEWKPIEVFYENNYTQAIAAMKLYDVLLVNSIVDGMNLVAKEGPIVNERDGVLIISETAGAYEQLKSAAFSVSPADIEGTARALYDAISASDAERSVWAASLRDSITNEDIFYWLTRQIEDISEII